MTNITYDLSLLLGTLLVAAGAVVAWGVATALMVTGGLVIGLTMFGAVFTRAKS